MSSVGMTGAARVPLIVGVSGASGTPYAAAVLRGLLDAGQPVDLVVSRAARLTLLDETGVAWHDGPGSLRAWLTSRLDADLPADLPAAAADALDHVRFWSPGDLAP